MKVTWETLWTYERAVTAGKITESEERMDNVLCIGSELLTYRSSFASLVGFRFLRDSTFFSKRKR